MSVVAIQRVIDGELTSADSATLRITSSAGVIVVATMPIAPTSPGVYSYETSYLPPDTYTATWTFSVTGWSDDVTQRAFVVDSPLVSYEGFTLQDLEQIVARRCGQHRRIKAGNAGTTTLIQSLRLKSTQNLGSFEAEFALRRGLFWDGSVVPNFNTDDRVRGLVTYTPTSGLLEVDRTYTNPPQENEAIELMYLDPEEELRPSVIEGLNRCFFWDTITLSYAGLGSDINVTDAVPWLISPGWIKRMSYGQLGSRLPPNRVAWYEPYKSGRSVYLRSEGLPPGNLTLVALRPYKSFVNGEHSYVGPNDDLDTLDGDIEYAAWAGVLQVWANHPERLAATAAQGTRLTLPQVSAQFTLKSLGVVEQVPEMMRHRYGTKADITQVGNLAEPVV